MTQLDLFAALAEVDAATQPQAPASPQDRRAEDAAAARDMLITSLQFAVPLRLAQVEATNPAAARQRLLNRWRLDASKVIAYRGDNLMFGSRTPGRPADVFNHLARALAVLAHQPGGVTAFEHTWCATHSPVGTPSHAPLCARCATDARPQRESDRSSRGITTVDGGELS